MYTLESLCIFLKKNAGKCAKFTETSNYKPFKQMDRNATEENLKLKS